MVEAVRDNNVSRIQQTLRSRGAGSVVLVKPGQLQNLKGIESISNRLPALHQELTDFIGSRLGIKVTDILCDPEGKIAVMAADPTFIERLRNSNGNLEALGHKVVLEMENESSGKLYLLKNENNIRLASSPIDIDAADRITSQINDLQRAALALTSRKFADVPPNTLPILEELFKANLSLEIRDQAETAYDSYVAFSSKGQGDSQICSRKIEALVRSLADLQVGVRTKTEPRKFETPNIPANNEIEAKLAQYTEYETYRDVAEDLNRFFRPPYSTRISFNSWLAINGAALKKFGIIPYLIIAEESQDNFPEINLPAVINLEAFNSAKAFIRLGVFLARKLKPLAAREVKAIFEDPGIRPASDQVIGNIFDTVDVTLAAKRSGVPVSEVFPLSSLISDSEKAYLILSSLIMSRANDLTLARSEALANSVGNFIEQGITSERDVSQLIEFIIENTPRIVLPEFEFEREITLLESGKKVVYKFGKLEYQDKLVEFLVTYVDGQEILLCSL